MILQLLDYFLFANFVSLFKVRTAACKSLGMLSKFSLQFANDALNLLMEMLNDDVAAVRLQTLQTLFEMATDDHLTVHEKHMQMVHPRPHISPA